MSYTSINNKQQEDNKNAPTSADRTAAIASDDPARQNLEEAFQNASTDDSGNSITTTNPHATPNSTTTTTATKKTTRAVPPRLTPLPRRSIPKKAVKPKKRPTTLSINNWQLPTTQSSFSRLNSYDNEPPTTITDSAQSSARSYSTEATNSLLSRFHKIQANLADLRGGVPTLNLLAEKHNLSLIRLRQDTEIHIAQALRTFETFSNVWQDVTKQHDDTLTNYIPGLVKQQRLLIDNIRHLTQLLKDVPGNGSTVLAYMPCHSLDTLEINTDNLTKRFLAYDSELAEQRFKLNRAAQELMQIQLSTKSALTSFEEYFPKQHTTHPIAVCTNTYRTGFVKETPKSNDGNTITRSTSLPPTLYNFQISTDIKKPPKLIK
eukprot:gene699-4577_t